MGEAQSPRATFKSRLFWPDAVDGPWDITLAWRLLSGRYECVGIEVFEALQLEPLPPGATAEEPYRSKPQRKILTAKVIRGLEWGQIIKTAREQVIRQDRYFAAALSEQGDAETAEKVAARRAAMEGRDTSSPAKRGRRPYEEQHYREVMRVYLRGLASERPTKAVAEHFKVSYPTAARWVRECRRRGILGDAPGRGVAGSERREREGS